MGIDFSDEMMKMMENRLMESDFYANRNNEVNIDQFHDYKTNGETFDLNMAVAGMGKFSKAVFGFRASGTRLPFKDNTFTAYVSPLVLQLIDDPKKMIQEAYRVLMP